MNPFDRFYLAARPILWRLAIPSIVGSLAAALYAMTLIADALPVWAFLAIAGNTVITALAVCALLEQPSEMSKRKQSDQ